MSKIHLKGRILQIIRENSHNKSDIGIWDYDVAKQILNEYGLDGAYAMGNVRVNLTELFSGALIKNVQEKIDEGEHFGTDRILFKFALTSFGEERMKDAGLI